MLKRDVSISVGRLLKHQK